MLIIDFAKLSPECLNTTMADMGMTDFKNLSFPVILERLGLGSETLSDEYLPVQQHSDIINFSGAIQKLREAKKIVDVIGPTKVQKGMPVCFSTLLGSNPKAYMRQYVDVARVLCGASNDLDFVVWLEDTFSVLKNGWNVSMRQQAIDSYVSFFKEEFHGVQFILSSEAVPAGIPKSFVEELFSVSAGDFLSVLPFHLRSPISIKVIDVVHFAWNCYILYRFPGIYLTGVSSKRNFQIFRQVVGKRMTVVLLPQGSEKFV